MNKLNELCNASKIGDVTSISRLVGEGVDVNGSCNFTTPLMCALQEKNYAAISALISNGARLYCTSERNCAYLLNKLRTDRDIVNKVCNAYGSILYKSRHTEMDETNEEFYTACISGNLRRAKQIFHSNKIDISQCCDDKKTVLSQSAYNGHLHVVKFLVANGAAIEPTDNRYPPLHDAAKRGHIEVVKFLIEKGANVDRVYNDMTPLMEAARHRQLEVVKWLVETGEADPNVCVLDKTALIHAIESKEWIQGCDGVITYLLFVSTW